MKRNGLFWNILPFLLSQNHNHSLKQATVVELEQKARDGFYYKTKF